jgi:hypothetical protein
MGGFCPKLCAILLQDPRYGGDKPSDKWVCLSVCFSKLELNWIVTDITSVQVFLDFEKKKTKKKHSYPSCLPPQNLSAQEVLVMCWRITL